MSDVQQKATRRNHERKNRIKDDISSASAK
jgi:hypothetical protein